MDENKGPLQQRAMGVKKEVRSDVPIWVRDWIKIKAARHGSTINKQVAKILESAVLAEQYKDGRICDRRGSRAA